MFYYVEISGNEIISKGDLNEKSELPKGFKEITKAQYNYIGKMPCNVEVVNGVVMGIEYIEPDTPIEVPPQLTLEEQLAELKNENTLLKAQNQVLVDRTDFHEELIAEMAMLVYP